MTAGRRKITPERALAARAAPQRDIMEIHRLLTHPSEHITRAIIKSIGFIITGKWEPCEECDQSNFHRYAVPKTTEDRTLERERLLYVDIAGPMESESAGESWYVMKTVDDFSWFKVSKYLETKSSVETEAVLERYTVIYITPEQLSIRAIRTDHGGEFEEGFQRNPDQLGIHHQHTPPDMPKYNGVAER